MLVRLDLVHSLGYRLVPPPHVAMAHCILHSSLRGLGLSHAAGGGVGASSFQAQASPVHLSPIWSTPPPGPCCALCETLNWSLTRAPAAAQPWSEGPQDRREALLGFFFFFFLF